MTCRPSEFDALADEWRENRLPRIDVSSAVLKAIREPDGRGRQQTADGRSVRGRKGRGNAAGRLVFSRTRKIGWMTVALFVLLTVSVGASVLPIRWEGGTFVIEDDGGRNARIDAWKERLFGPEPTYQETIEEVLRTGKNMEKTVTLEEAAREFPFALLRPAADAAYRPARSIGALMNETMQVSGKDPEVIGHRPVFHDFYELPRGWVIVTQSLNEAATRAAEGTVTSRTGTYVGNWEQVGWGGRALAMYAPSAKQNRLVMEYKTATGQVLDVNVTGTASKEDLVLLAEAYIGKRN